MQTLFDSSRFNYDSDEEEEGEGDAEQQGQGEDESEEVAAAMAATSAAAAAGQQQRSARRRAGGGTATGEAASELAADLAAGGVVLPPARGVKVKSSDFVKSSVTVEQCPPARFPEFAGGRRLAGRLAGWLASWMVCVRQGEPPPGGPHCNRQLRSPLPTPACLLPPAVIGRSNVGKSSLINMLTGRNALAMVSKTPGAWGLPLLLLPSSDGPPAVDPPLPLPSQLVYRPLHAQPAVCLLYSDRLVLLALLPLACLPACLQARPGASTTSSSTAPGTWWTSQDTGGCLNGAGLRWGGS